MSDSNNVNQHRTDTDGVRSALLEAYARLLRPLIRILIRHGVPFGEFADTVKRVYVDSASEDFALPSRKTSGSRLAILTGLTRKEVKRILDSNKSGVLPPAPSSTLSRAGRVLTGWHNDPDFLATHYGPPRDLPFDSNATPSFSELVRRYSGDMPARAMLEELERVGAVVTTEQNLIHVRTRVYVPAPLNPESIERLGATLRDHASTLDHNLRPDRTDPARFERRVYSTEGIPSPHLVDFQDFLDARGQQFLETLDNWLTAHETEEGSTDAVGERRQIGVGIYYFESPAVTDDKDPGGRDGS